MRKDRFIVGVICLALAAWVLLVGTTGGTVAPAIALAVLGIWGVATARKRQATADSVTIVQNVTSQHKVFTRHFLNFYCLFIGDQKVYGICILNDIFGYFYVTSLGIKQLIELKPDARGHFVIPKNIRGNIINAAWPRSPGLLICS